MQGAITHFEIYGEAPEALVEFYRAVLGWTIEKMEGLAYWRIQADPADVSAVGGGITHLPAFDNRGWLPYVKVSSIDAVLAEAERRGGVLLRPKTAVARTAWIAVIEDPAKNRFGIWQPDASAFPLPDHD